MNVMILGHKQHGKTTVGTILRNVYGFTVLDATEKLIEVAKRYVRDNPTKAGMTLQGFNYALEYGKDSVRRLLKEALTHYTKDDKSRFIREHFQLSDVYAGCRSSEEYQADTSLYDMVLWVRDTRKPEDDPTMEIEYDPDTMWLIDNSGTYAALEHSIKRALHQRAGIPMNTYDKTVRDSLITNLLPVSL